MAELQIVLITPDPNLFTRQHNKAMREANRLGAERYHEVWMPDHFKMVGYGKYGISKRSKIYNRRKHRKLNHVLPNVFTGRTRQLVLSQRRIRATPKGARLEMRAAFAGGSGRTLTAAAAKRLFKAGKRNSAEITKEQIQKQVEVVNRIAELEATATEEVADLARYRADRYARWVANYIADGGKIRKRGKRG